MSKFAITPDSEGPSFKKIRSDDPEYVPGLRSLGQGQFGTEFTGPLIIPGPIGPPSRTPSIASSPALSPAAMLLAPGSLDRPIEMVSSPAAMTPFQERDDTMFAYASESERIDPEEENILFSGVPETIVPNISAIIRENISSTYISVTAAITELRRVGGIIEGKGREIAAAVRTTGEYISSMAAPVRAMGDKIIEETKERRAVQQQLEKLEEQKVAKKMIDNAVAKLANNKDQTKKIRIDAVLDMVQRETLAELVIDDVMPGSVKEIPRLLVMPILDIVCHYDEYFGYTDMIVETITENESLTIDRAYSEFRNKQKIRDMINLLYRTRQGILRRDVTLSEIIDDLFDLYNRNFSLPTKGEQQKLSVNGRVRVMKSLYTKSPDTVLTNIPSEKSKRPREIPVISVIDYSAVWDKHAKSVAIVDEELAALRAPINAAPDETVQAGVAIPRGRNTRDWDIDGNAGVARFAGPMAHVEIRTEDEVADMPDSQSSDISELADAESQGSDYGVSRDSANPKARYQILYIEQKLMNQIIPPEVEEHAMNIKMQEAKARNITRKEGEMAKIADRTNDLADELIKEVHKLALSLDVDELMSEEQKTRKWDRDVHLIFLTVYSEYDLLDKQRYELDRVPSDASSAKASTVLGGFGFFKKSGKKSHKHHKKHHKKHTRKNGKRSTRKLHKNHKKRSGHTKKH
jgi:hypothetical protein